MGNTGELDEEQQNNQIRYLEANIQAAKRGIKIYRVFIIDKIKDLSPLRHIIEQQVESGISVRYAISNKLIEKLKQPNLSLSIVNILICDRDILIHSFTQLRHDGRIVLRKELIDSYENFFWKVWENSEIYTPKLYS